jgi:hypothetical protein
MLGDDEIKEMQEEIDLLEKEIAQRKKELSDRRYSGLRAAVEARQAADKAILEELRNLGYAVTRKNWMF